MLKQQKSDLKRAFFYFDPLNLSTLHEDDVSANTEGLLYNCSPPNKQKRKMNSITLVQLLYDVLNLIKLQKSFY